MAGVIRSSDSVHKGIAPGASLWVGSPCNESTAGIGLMAEQAMTWGAKILNLSWGDLNNGVLLSSSSHSDKYYDEVVINRFRTVIAAAGNNGEPGCDPEAGYSQHVNSPASAYNVIAVGSYRDNNTTDRSLHAIERCSSWDNPTSTNNDRQKPEVVAPGVNISSTSMAYPWNTFQDSGTSVATPIVSGIAALMLQAHSTLSYWPEANRAILMATAIHNIEGDSRLSERDGAGGVNARAAVDVARKARGGWTGRPYDCATGMVSELMPLTKGLSTRVVIAWDSNPSYAGYASRPSADLDLSIVDPNGLTVASSASYDNTYEIVEFTPALSGNFRLEVRNYRCEASPRWLGWAWYPRDVVVSGTPPLGY